MFCLQILPKVVQLSYSYSHTTDRGLVIHTLWDMSHSYDRSVHSLVSLITFLLHLMSLTMECNNSCPSNQACIGPSISSSMGDFAWFSDVAVI